MSEHRDAVLTSVITAKDEELHIARCVSSAAPLGPVIVVDSESTDATADVARRSGASVVVQPWQGYAAQKNWALSNLPIESDWVLFLDADERLTDASRAEIRRAVL